MMPSGPRLVLSIMVALALTLGAFLLVARHDSRSKLAVHPDPAQSGSHQTRNNVPQRRYVALRDRSRVSYQADVNVDRRRRLQISEIKAVCATSIRFKLSTMV